MTMYEDLFSVFDAWEDIYKARKAKGLDNWDRLAAIATKLAGKQSKDITYTCCHPKHQGVPEKHVLGSSEGNLHFLMGYGNPGFCLAPYHWHIIYPELADDQIDDLSKELQHPSKPQLWEMNALDVLAEGDQELGTPHPFAAEARRVAEVQARLIPATTPYDTYYADPVAGLVYHQETQRAYKWDMVSTSFFAAQNPEIVEAMNQTKPVFVEKPSIPEVVKHLSVAEAWDPTVYPLVKSLFPVPGSIVCLNLDKERVYGVMKSNRIVLVDEVGQPLSFSQYDKTYEHIDLRKGGDIHPCIVYNFAKKYLGIGNEGVEELCKSSSVPSIEDDFPYVVEGNPSPGYDAVPAHFVEDVKRSVTIDTHVFKVTIS